MNMNMKKKLQELVFAALGLATLGVVVCFVVYPFVMAVVSPALAKIPN